MQLFWHLQLCGLQIRELPALQPQKLKDVKPEFYDRNCTYFTSTGDFCNEWLLLSALLLKMCLFCRYQRQVVKNAQVLAEGLKVKGYTIVTGGTDNHLVLIDLRNKKLSGSKGERILEDVGISVNKNTGELLIFLMCFSFFPCIFFLWKAKYRLLVFVEYNSRQKARHIPHSYNLWNS